MAEKLKVVIVGFGKMGKVRLASMDKRQDIAVVGICEPSPQGVPSGLSVFQDYKELACLDPDIVFVCTPNKFLPEIVCFFLNKKVHVFCEKPPGRCKEDVQKMLEAEKNNPGVKLKFGFNHRYHQAVLDAKSIIDKGRLGKVLWVRGVYGKGGGPRYDRDWRNSKDIAGGGILMDQGIHMVDLFRLFCGEFNDIKSFIGQSYWSGEVEDNAFVLLRNDQGQVGALHSSATQWHYKFLLEVYLEKGYVTIQGILSSTKNYGAETLKIARCVYDEEGYPLPNPQETISYYEEDFSWDRELEEFVSCIQKDELIKVGSCQEAYKTMVLIEQIYQADPKWNNNKYQKEGVYEDSRLDQ